MSSPIPEKVAELYDAPGGQGEHLIFEGQFHWGYWDETNPEASLDEAADHLTQIIINLKLFSVKMALAKKYNVLLLHQC